LTYIGGELELQTEHENANDELIKLAYSMVVEPQKLHMLQSILDQKLRGIYDTSDSDKTSSDAPELLLKDVEVHFQNAMELMEKQGRQGQSNSIAVRMIPTPIKLRR